MKLILRLAAAAAVCLIPAVTAAAPLQVDGGLIAGISTGEMNVYRGVPFAAPPAGSATLETTAARPRLVRRARR